MVLPGFCFGDSVEGAFLENRPVVSVDVVSAFMFSPNAGSDAPDQMCLVGAKGKKKKKKHGQLSWWRIQTVTNTNQISVGNNDNI